ncbi:MAG: hypothetical protein L0J57_07695 [Brachybacterium sp.]|uniref:hypothetical protein n=1 Tax=Brachybacterium sp. TaxID=1891286 RepID=UPI00264E4543|nr:hypothetical protein [Brachybacterium sp.]MDN6302914.1 hypothetical protein [Brachybacterium sp.]MDN6400784.1 hypothetical protein [Brachybacterium sp.]
MAYQQSYQQPYQYAERPRRRGLKRTIFGVLGILANAVGLFVMPMIAGFIALMVSGLGAMELTALEADGGTIESSTWSVYSIAVPEEDLESVSCEFEGAGVQPTRDISEEPLYTMDGVDYYDVYTLTADSGEITVHCEGSDAIGVSEMGMAGTFISTLVGLVLPIVLGLIALAMTIWGIIALITSPSRY